MAGTSIEQLFDQALAHHTANRLAQAEPLYRQILTRDPNHADSLHSLGMIALASGHPNDAFKLVQRAIQLNPGAALYHGNLGIIFAKLGRIDEAMATYRRAIVMQPLYPEAHSNLGAALLDRFQLDEALAEFKQTIAQNPNFGEAFSNMGNTLRELGRVPEAAAALRQAVALAPQEAKIVWNLAFALLLNGELRDGWRAAEARWHVPEVAMHREIQGPLWDGGPLNGRTLLLHDEQGYGDTIHFVRYAPAVRARGGNVVLCCQPPLQRLLQGQLGLQQVVYGNSPIQFHVHSPLLSLPRLFDTTLATIPAAPAYLTADASLAQQWRRQLDVLPGRLKVGLAWAGNPGHSRDRVRSIDLQMLAPLADVKDVTFVSLQKSPALREPVPAGMHLVDWTQQLNDFSDTAALISQLDLLISVDTAVVHLAGALGKPVWMLTPFSPDWRWLMGRSDSPWYPTVRLVRQTRREDWETPIRQIATQLSAM